MIWTTIALALQGIQRHKLRSILTVLGIVIGVWSVVTMVTLGNATTLAITSSISALGSNTLTVNQGRGFGRGGGGAAAKAFTGEDVIAIQSQIGGVTLVVPQVQEQKTVVLNAANWQTTVMGTTDAYLEVQQWAISEGRRFTADEDQSGPTVCLLGDTVRDKLTPNTSAVGTIVRVGDISCTVVGVLTPRGAGFGSNPDDSVIMPIKAVQRDLIGSNDISSLQIAYDPRFDGGKIKDAIVALLRERRLIGAGVDDDFSIFDARQIADTVRSTTTYLTAFMGAVGAVSLIVGGIGVMNIMLVSVTERTREIGTRLAVGAVSRDVLVQFLVEAVVLSCLGGGVGLILANLTMLAVAPLIGVGFYFNPGINLLSFMVSALIGIVFGYVPARRAAALNPIEALRHE